MLNDEMKQALNDECGNPIEELDNTRLEKLEDIFKTAMTLEPARKKWVMDAPRLIKPLATMIHGPMTNGYIMKVTAKTNPWCGICIMVSR